MGLLDTLAESNVPALSIPASLFGGQNARSRLRNFAEQEYPAIAREFANATTEQGINRAMDMFIQRSMAAGVRPEQMKELSRHLIEPAMRNLGANEIAKLTGQLQGQPEQPGFEDQAAQMSRAPVPATPGRQFNQADALKLAEIEGKTGVKAPANLAPMLQAPAQIEASQALAKQREESQRKTAREVEALERKAKGISQFSNVPPQGGMISPQQMAEHYPAGLPQFNPQRELSEGGMDLRQQGLDIARQRMEAAGERASTGIAAQRLALDREKFEQSKSGSETVTEAADPTRDRRAKLILDQQADEAGIAKLPPKEQAAAIKKMAADLGYEIEGTPQMGKVGATFGFGGETSVTGITGWKRKPTTRTTTKTPAGGAKGNNDPLGIRPKK